MIKNLFAIVLFSLCFLQSAYSQFYKYSNEFLAIGIGGQGLGMSGARVALTNDVTSAYWNPAGLSLIDKKFEAAFMHSEYFAGIAKFDYAGITAPLNDPLNRRMIGFSLIRFGVDNIPNTLFLVDPDGSINYDNIRPFSVADYAALFSYSQEMPLEGFRIGGNLKIIHRIAGEFASSWGVGADLGVQYQKDNWRFGAMGRDITTTFNAWSFNFTDAETAVLLGTNNVVPQNSIELTSPKIILAGAYNFEFGKNVTLNPELDLDVTTDGKRNVLISAKPISIDPHLGVEAGYSKTIYLRAGINNIQRIKNDVDGSQATTLQPNLGVGLHIRSVTIDYALTNLGGLNSSLYSHVFSLKIGMENKVTYAR